MMIIVVVSDGVRSETTGHAVHGLGVDVRVSVGVGVGVGASVMET